MQLYSIRLLDHKEFIRICSTTRYNIQLNKISNDVDVYRSGPSQPGTGISCRCDIQTLSIPKLNSQWHSFNTAYNLLTFHKNVQIWSWLLAGFSFVYNKPWLCIWVHDQLKFNASQSNNGTIGDLVHWWVDGDTFFFSQLHFSLKGCWGIWANYGLVPSKFKCIYRDIKFQWGSAH